MKLFDKSKTSEIRVRKLKKVLWGRGLIKHLIYFEPPNEALVAAERNIWVILMSSVPNVTFRLPIDQFSVESLIKWNHDTFLFCGDDSVWAFSLEGERKKSVDWKNEDRYKPKRLLKINDDSFIAITSGSANFKSKVYVFSYLRFEVIRSLSPVSFDMYSHLINSSRLSNCFWISTSNFIERYPIKLINSDTNEIVTSFKLSINQVVEMTSFLNIQKEEIIATISSSVAAIILYNSHKKIFQEIKGIRNIAYCPRSLLLIPTKYNSSLIKQIGGGGYLIIGGLQTIAIIDVRDDNNYKIVKHSSKTVEEGSIAGREIQSMALASKRTNTSQIVAFSSTAGDVRIVEISNLKLYTEKDEMNEIDIKERCSFLSENVREMFEIDFVFTVEVNNEKNIHVLKSLLFC